MSSIKKYANESFVIPSVNRTGFAEMQSRASLALTAPYHAEELRLLQETLEDYAAQGITFDHLIAVGAANLRYIDVALKHGMAYTVVEPNLDDYLPQDKIDFIKRNNCVHFLKKSFSSVAAPDLPHGRKLFFFLFNVFPYIDGALETQKRLMQQGDVAIVSAWNRESLGAHRLQRIYYHYLNETAGCQLSPEKTGGYMDQLEKDCQGFSKDQKRHTGNITDILVVKK